MIPLFIFLLHLFPKPFLFFLPHLFPYAFPHPSSPLPICCSIFTLFFLPFLSLLFFLSCFISVYLNACIYSEVPSQVLPSYCANPSSFLALSLCLPSFRHLGTPSHYTPPPPLPPSPTSPSSFPHYPLASLYLPFPPLFTHLPSPVLPLPFPLAFRSSPVFAPFFSPRLSHFVLPLGPLFICESLRLD